MFTKTGLRPRETRSRSGTGSSNVTGGGHGFTSLKPRSGNGEKPRPTAAVHRRQVPTTHLGAAATAFESIHERGRATSAVFMRGGAERVVVSRETSPSSTRRKKFGDRGNNSRGRREIYMYGGGRSGRSRSAGRRRKVSTAPRVRHPIRKRPEWDDSLRDTSQYRLTPEEAMRRKISLVSKHNTLVFGLGSSRTPTEAVTSSSSATVAGEVARRRSAKRVEHHQQSRQQSGKSRTSFAASANSKSVSAIYGGGGSCGRMGSDVVLEPASATEHDLTAAVSRQGSDPTDPCEINDATITLYAKRGGGDDSNNCERRHDDACGGSSGGGGEDGGEDEVELSSPGGKGGSKNGRGVSGPSGLVGIEVGIEAFSKRVGRLDAHRKDCCGSSQPDDVSLCLTEVHEGAASGELLCQLQQYHATADDDESGNHLPAKTVNDASEVDNHHQQQQQQQQHSHHSRVNPWSFSAPSPASSCRKQRLLRKAVAERSPCTGDDGGGRDEIDLVKRIQLLEAQVLRLGSARPSAITATTAVATTENAGGNPKASVCQTGVGAAAEMGLEEVTTAGGVDDWGHLGSAAREKKMRAVIADLLSLSAVLLERATEAERRFRDVTGNGLDSQRVVGGNAGDDADDVDKRVRLVRASAEAVVDLAGYGGNSVAQPVAINQGTVTNAASAATATAPTAPASASASAPPEEGTALFFERSMRKRPPPPPPRRSTPRSAPNDCWVEGLNAVGRLVSSQSSSFGHDENKRVSTDTGTSYHANTLKKIGPVEGQLPLQPPPPPPPPESTANGAARVNLWWPATQDDNDTALAAPVLLNTAENTLLADGGCVAAGPVRSSRSLCASAPREVERETEGEEEEDSRAFPASSAPIPSNKPQHPFGGNRTGPRVRSPRWIRQPPGQAGRGESVSGSGPRSYFSPAFTAADEGRDDGSMHSGSARGQGKGICGGDETDMALRPPIGQWYTPTAPGVGE
ncbi:unnamed protein product [Pylaiella littoralis]